MGSRRESRELAMQALFYIDTSQDDPKETLELFCKIFVPSKRASHFFLRLVNGVIHTRSEIDSIIERFSSNWKMSRMSCVDRNVLRIAVYELLFCDDIPPRVSINEAIDVGKRFGAEESGAFINGILDSISIALEKNDSRVKIEVQTDRAACPAKIPV